MKYECEEMEMVEHAYAITVHNSQGSKYLMVSMPWLSMFYKMLRRNTRLGKRVIREYNRLLEEKGKPPERRVPSGSN